MGRYDNFFPPFADHSKRIAAAFFRIHHGFCDAGNAYSKRSVEDARASLLLNLIPVSERFVPTKRDKSSVRFDPVIINRIYILMRTDTFSIADGAISYSITSSNYTVQHEFSFVMSNG